jgi:hypothetical protein
MHNFDFELVGGQKSPAASVGSRANCISVPRKRLCAGVFRMFRPNSLKPMRGPTPRRVIAKLSVAWGVLPWHWLVRRCWPGGEARFGDDEAFSKWKHLECSATTRDSRRDRAPARSTGQSCWHPLRRTRARTLRRCTCVAWLTCAFIRARKQRLSSRKSWIARALIGPVSGATLTGDNSIRSPILGGARLALAGDKAKAEKAFQDFFVL